jgi:hypothetical protein
MAAASHTNRGASKAFRSSWEYRLIFAASYPIFLVAEAGARCLPGRADKAAAPVHNRSVFRAAKEAADTCLPYAFLG